MKKFTVGVIGNGFVGESQAFAFSPTSEIKIFDKDPLKSMNTLDEVLESDFIFVCVPTPMKKSGKFDLITKPIAIEENVFIGARAFIMPGITLGKDSIIGACSVVTKSVDPGKKVAGNPAKSLA